MSLFSDYIFENEEDDCIANFKHAIEENPEDAEAWYFLFLAENERFEKKSSEIKDEMAFTKASDLADPERSKSLENEFLIATSLSYVPYMASLYLAIKYNSPNGMEKYFQHLDADEKTYEVLISDECLLSLMDEFASSKGSYQRLFATFLYVLSKKITDERYIKFFSKINSYEKITDEDVKIYDMAKKLDEMKTEISHYMEEIEQASKALNELYNEKEKLDAKIQSKEKEKESFELLKKGLENKMSSLIHRMPVGDLITMGKYDGKDIVWRVLKCEDTRALLISDIILDARPFDDDSNNYENSMVRFWMNHKFYKEAFTDAERQRIIATSIDNSSKTTGVVPNRYAGNETIDYVFLLSLEEANALFETKEDRMSHGTDTAIHNGLFVKTGFKDKSGHIPSPWMLRSPDNAYRDCIYYVGFGGGITLNNSCRVNTTNCGFRPAMWVKF